MAAADLEVVARMYEVWNERGLDAVAEECWAGDIEWHNSPDLPDAAVYYGREATCDFYRGVIEALGEMPVRVVELIDCGDEVVGVLRFQAVGPGSGTKVEATVCHVLRLNDGRVTRCRAFFSREQALAAAGWER